MIISKHNKPNCNSAYLCHTRTGGYPELRKNAQSANITHK